MLARPNDGLVRCPWPYHDPLYVVYHDQEWGVPEYDDQAGPLWITILRKRENFRRALRLIYIR